MNNVDVNKILYKLKTFVDECLTKYFRYSFLLDILIIVAKMRKIAQHFRARPQGRVTSRLNGYSSLFT